MTRRPGMTLTEVLVAIFIVAIGLSGVMAMVPFGAKQMSDALVADRATTHAASIDGMVRGFWKTQIVEDTTGNGSGEPVWAALDNPGGGLAQIPSSSTEPSYPVFLDQMGVTGRLTSDPAQTRVGDGGGTSVPRRQMNFIGGATVANNSLLALRMWSQADGFTWDENQDGAVPKSGADMRELRYNALAVIQRPNNSNRNTATLKVVVFSNRRDGFFPAGSEAVVSVPPADFLPGTTTTAIPTTADIKKGSWIIDASIIPNTTIRHANFYRIVSAVDNGNSNANGVPVFDVELHTPIKRVDGQTGQYSQNATIVVMPGVAAVFDRPALVGDPN